MSQHVADFLRDTAKIAETIDQDAIESMIQHLLTVRSRGGRVFFLGVGGSAANCTHAVNDFRKLAGIDAHAPVDNVDELTARTNDEGWETVFSETLKVSRLNSNDAIFILSVGGGDLEKNVSPNLVRAIDFAKEVGAKVMGIVSRTGGYTKMMADACVVIPIVNPKGITPHAEGWQGVVWHMMVSDPRMLTRSNKWESIEDPTAVITNIPANKPEIPMGTSLN